MPQIFTQILTPVSTGLPAASEAFILPGFPALEQMLSAAVLLAITAVYLFGWIRLRRLHPRLAGPIRLGFFLTGISLLVLAFVWPVPQWAGVLLTGRSIQKALIGMLAPWLLWLGLPFHVLAWNLPAKLRRKIRHRLYLGAILRRITRAPVAWFVFISAFLLWHDPTYVNWAIDRPGVRMGAAWVLLIAALLFWQHVVDTGPRIHARLPSWIMAFYLLGVEIPNMAAGITIAFTIDPIYSGYAARQEQLTGLPFGYASDQMTGGAIIWVFGSIVYISAIIGVLYRLFRREGSNAPRPIMGWDNMEKAIAPGLEHRVRQEKADIPWQDSGSARRS